MDLFKIEKGSHSSGFYFSPKFNVDTFEFDVMFTKECLYKLKSNHGQINKLFGVSYGWHHKNSYRIGWAGDVNIDEIVLYQYVYSAGVLSSFEIFRVHPYKTVTIHWAANNFVSILCGDAHIKHSAIETNKSRFSYVLHPYFGGKESAPHDITLSINNISIK